MFYPEQKLRTKITFDFNITLFHVLLYYYCFVYFNYFLFLESVYLENINERLNGEYLLIRCFIFHYPVTLHTLLFCFFEWQLAIIRIIQKDFFFYIF